MKVTDFVNGLQLGGYWDDYCFDCKTETPHSNADGVCDICGWNTEEGEREINEESACN